MKWRRCDGLKVVTIILQSFFISKTLSTLSPGQTALISMFTDVQGQRDQMVPRAPARKMHSRVAAHDLKVKLWWHLAKKTTADQACTPIGPTPHPQVQRNYPKNLKKSLER